MRLDVIDVIDVKRFANGDVQGFFDPQTGKFFLITDNLTAKVRAD
ncbi:MAG: hypothetical protein PHW78_02275 [Macromonas bipunctata]|nr:hypothetical protein [Macromonas bipunctata]